MVPYWDEFDYTACGVTVRYVAESSDDVDGVIMVHKAASAPPPAAPRPGQYVSDEDGPAECVAAPSPARLGDGMDELSVSQSQATSWATCEEFYKAAQEWMEEAAEYLMDAPSVAANLALTRGRTLKTQFLDKMMDQRALLDSAAQLKGCARPSGGGWGDPHLVSLDGLGFDLQSVGEFELVNAPAVGLQVQARFVPMGSSNSVSVIDRIAANVNSFAVEINSTHNVLIDGQPTALGNGDMLYFGGGSWLLRTDDTYFAYVQREEGFGLLEWSRHSLRVRLSPGVPSTGILGNHDGDPTNDLRDRDGVPAPKDTARRIAFLHGDYAQSWRVTSGSSLFTYAAGTDTTTFTDATFPHVVKSIDDFPSEDVSDARDLCTQVEEGTARDGCVLDALVTGGDSMLDAALHHGSAPVDATIARFGSDGVLAQDFDNRVSVNFSHARRGYADSLGGFIGPLKNTDVYEFNVPVRSSHSAVNLAVDIVAIGNLTAARQRAVRIDINDDQHTVRLARAGATADRGTIAPLESGDLSDGRPYTRYRYTTTTPQVARSLNVSMTPTGFSRLNADAVAIDNIALQLADAGDPETHVLLIGDTVLPDDTTGAGEIDAPGARDAYQFTVPAGGQNLWLEAVHRPGFQSSCPSWLLTRVSTGEEIDACFTNELLSEGDYELVIASPPQASLPYRYGFQLHAGYTHQDRTVSVGASPVIFEPGDGTGVGVVPGTGGGDNLTLDITTPGVLEVVADCLEPDDPGCLISIGMSGHGWRNGKQRAAFDVQPGTTSLWLNYPPGPHRYRLSLRIRQVVPHPLTTGDVIRPSGASEWGTFSPEAMLDRYEFAVPAGGERLYLTQLPEYQLWSPVMFNPSTERTCAAWRLYPKTAAPNASVRTGCPEYFSGGYTWLDEGDWVLDVLPGNGVPLNGEYGFEFALADNAEHQTFATPLTTDHTLDINPDLATGAGVLNGIRARDTFTFTAPEAMKLGFTITCPDTVCPTVTSLGRDRGTYTESINPRQADLVAGGSYALTVSGGTGGTHNYTLHAEAITPFPYSIGQTISADSHGAGSGTFDELGEIDRYRFHVPNGGTTLALQTTGDPQLQLFDSTGTRVQDDYLLTYGSHLSLPAGSYELRARTNGYDYDPNYQLRLANVATPSETTLTFNPQGIASHTGQLADNGYIDDYTITIPTAGDYAIVTTGDPIDLVATSAPDANTWIDTYGNRTRLEAGTYTLRATTTSQRLQPTNYTITVRALTAPDLISYTLGQAISGPRTDGLGTLEGPVAEDRYNFTLTTAAEISVLSTGLDVADWCSTLTLAPDDPEAWVYWNCADPVQPQQLEAGDYTLTVLAPTDLAGDLDYTLTIATPTTAATTAIEVGPDELNGTAHLEGTFQNTGDIHAFTFTLEEDTLGLAPWLQLEPISNCTSYRLFGPDDYLLAVNGTSTGPWGRNKCAGWAGWAASGTYRVEVIGTADEEFDLDLYTTNDAEWSWIGNT